MLTRELANLALGNVGRRLPSPAWALLFVPLLCLCIPEPFPPYVRFENTHRTNPDLASLRNCWWDNSLRGLRFHGNTSEVAFGFLYKNEYYRFSFEPATFEGELEYAVVSIESKKGLTVDCLVRHRGPVRTPRPAGAHFLQSLIPPRPRLARPAKTSKPIVIPKGVTTARGLAK